MDAALQLMNMQKDEYPSLFPNTRWTCMGCIYTGSIEYAYELFTDFMKGHTEQEIDPNAIAWGSIDVDTYTFVAGFHSNWTNHPWHNCDEVYGIANISSLHWAAYAYNFAAKEVRVYDSMMSILTDQREEVFRRHAAIAPSLYNESVNFNYEKFDPTVPFTIKYIDVPQQPNSADCGVFAIKFVQCLAMGAEISGLNPKSFNDYRMNIAMDLVKWVQVDKHTFEYVEKNIKT